jgi:peptidoglycan/xylan/chitin deacetylase (PgdA/CDA1 family)
MLVLLYHRVAHLECDPHGLAVDPERFGEHCEILRRRFDVAPVREWKRAGRQVAITFDDGYADNATVAREILAAAGLPATFFITAGRLGARDEAWWDRLAQLLLERDTAARPLDIEVGGQPFWADIRSPAARERAHLALFYRLRPLRLTEIDKTLAALEIQLAASSAGRETHRWMTVEELQTLAATDGIEIGAHTVTHPFLSKLDREDQRREIEGSRQALERVLHRSPGLFAYPYGGPDAFDDETTRLVGEAGYSGACMAVGGIARADCDPRRIPRNVVGNWDPERFERWLDRWESEF